MPSITVRVPAKVNIQLVVGGVRTDGFHDLANVFCAVSLYDDVTATPADTLRVTVSGPYADRVPTDDSNLAARAARLLATRHGRRPDVHLHIAKDIPVAGGMAGGSADAAAALLACDALWSTGTSRDELLDLAAELGSDVPFALLGGVALGRGRGELLRPLPAGQTLHWVFAVADGGLSTPSVFRACDELRRTAGQPWTSADRPTPEPTADLLDAVRHGDPVALGGLLGDANDLQAAALTLRPSLADTLRTGAGAGALGALVSGSGPTCAFLAKDTEAAHGLAEALRRSGHCQDARVAHGPVDGAAVLTG